MKVIAAGFSKTGTKSVAEALRILGYSVYDYEEHVYLLGDEWTNILTRGGDSEDFRRMYKNVDAVTDLPACYFWEELHKAFPVAQIIFMHRENEDAWFKSIKYQIESASVHWFLSILLSVSPTKNKIHRLGALIGQTVYGARLYDAWPFNYVVNEMLLRKVYRTHNAHVLNNAPKDKLLVYDVKEGWGPLCEFLGDKVPNVEFPHKNNKAEIIDEMLRTSPMMQQMKKEALIALSILTLVAAALIFYYFEV